MPSTNGHGPKRAILYTRVSTDEQARSGYSLAQQLEALREYAAREGYVILEEVADPGQSGASLERPGMDRVRDLVAVGGVSVVLAQDRDRFSREPAYTYLLKREFAEHGTKICALNDRGGDSPEGELTDGILDQLAKFERAKTAARSRRGNPEHEANVWLGRIAATELKRSGFQDMAAEGLITLDELRGKLAELDDLRNTAERELRAIEGRKEALQQLERDRESLVEHYANMAPEALDSLTPEERHQLYKILRLRVTADADRNLAVEGMFGEVLSVQDETITWFMPISGTSAPDQPLRRLHYRPLQVHFTVAAA